MTLHQIECFIYAASEGSFSKAGNLLFMSPQAVSRQIKALEHELKFELFERHNLGVVLTESGRIMFDCWKEMYFAHMKAADQAYDVAKGRSQMLALGMEDIGNVTGELMEKLSQFNEENPSLEINCQILPAKMLLQKLYDNSLHVIIVVSSELESCRDLNKLELHSCPIEIGICMSNKHPLAKNSALTIADCKNQRIASLSRAVSQDYYNRVRGALENVGIADQVEIVEYDSRQNMELAIVSQKCITITYDKMFMSRSDKLSFFPLKEFEKTQSVCLVWKNDAYTVKAKAMLNCFDHT